MKSYVLALFILFGYGILFAQENKLSAFDNLIYKTWYAEGNWGDGSKFKQETSFVPSLERHIILAESKGYTNQEQTKYGLRNHGIRKYVADTGKIKFWEFDAFGGLTMGEVIIEDKNILYVYKYGESLITDMWEYVNDSTYNFKVGSYSKGNWEQTYLETKFKLVSRHTEIKDLPDLKSALEGNWTSIAWDGVLNEEWISNTNDIENKAQYIENGEVGYEAQNKIEIIGEQVILISVIKNSNPKIFKAVSFSENHITFENADYTNPSIVTYEFISENEFNRTIRGIENNKPSVYTFKFKKVHQ